MDSSERLAQRQLLFYVLPAIPLALPTLVLFINLPTLYVEQFGLGFALTGFILMLARVGDLLVDPWIGSVVDRSSSAQRRKLVLLGALLCVPGLIFLLTPLPGWTAVSLLLSLSLVYLGWTLIQIPYLTLLPGLSPLSYERTRIASWREGLSLIGLLLSASIPAALVFAGYTPFESLWGLIVGALVLGALSITGLLRGLNWPEKHRVEKRGTWRQLLRNRKASRLLASWFTNGLANGIPAVLFPLYVTQVLELPEEMRSYLILLYFACAVASLPVWLRLSRSMDKDRLWRAAMVLAVVAFIPASFLGAGDVPIFVLICVVTGFTLGADLALPQAMQADVTDWHRFRFNTDQTALLFAYWNLSTKLALALSAIIAFGALELIGGTTEELNPTHLALIYALLPGVLKLVAIAQLRSIGISRTWHQAIASRLQQRGI